MLLRRKKAYPDYYDIRRQENMTRAASWSEAKPSVQRLCLLGGIKDYTPILGLKNLRDLYVSELTSERLDIVCQLTNLRSLCIDGFRKVESLEPLRSLNGLEALALEINMQGLSLDFLSELTELRALYLRAYVSTAINGGHVKVESFAPLSGLKKLEYLDIFAVRPIDATLEPLAKLKTLYELKMMNDFPACEFARLAAALPHTKGIFQEPYFTLGPDSDMPCKKCGGIFIVVLVGSGTTRRGLLCPVCDEDRIAKHVAEYERMKREFISVS